MASSALPQWCIPSAVQRKWMTAGRPVTRAYKHGLHRRAAALYGGRCARPETNLLNGQLLEQPPEVPALVALVLDVPKRVVVVRG